MAVLNKRFVTVSVIFCSALLLLLFIAPLFAELTKPGPETYWPRAINAESGRTAIIASLPTNGIIKNPILAKDGSRALFHVKLDGSREQLLLWRDGVGAAVLWEGRAGGLQEYSADDGLRTVYLLLQGRNQDLHLQQWQEGVGSAEPLKGSFQGDWSLAVSGDASRVLFVPRDNQASYLPAAGEGDVGSGGFIAQLEERGTLRLMPLDEVGKGRAVKLSGEQYAVLEQDGDYGAFKITRGRLQHALRPGDIDVNGDGTVELLTIDTSVAGAPVWEAFSRSGESGRSERAKQFYQQWRLGSSTGIPVPGDYNGDGQVDLGTYLPGYSPLSGDEGNWEIYLSRPPGSGRESALRRLRISWGHGGMKAVPGDYDGDGLFDPAVFDPPTGEWRVLLAAGGFNRAKALLAEPGYGLYQQWGLPTDTPVPGDYNGDGCSDFAVVRAEGIQLTWLIKLASCNGQEAEGELRYTLGIPGDIPIPGDFDGDGAVEPTVYRPKKAMWLNRNSDGKIETLILGKPDGLPLAIDYDGDGSADPVVYMPQGKNRWLIYNSGASAALKEMLPNRAPVTTRLRWGSTTARPVQWVLGQHQREGRF